MSASGSSFFSSRPSNRPTPGGGGGSGQSQAQAQGQSESQSHSHSTGNPANGPFGFNFDFPRINIQNITQTLTNRNFSPPNLSNLMTPNRGSQSTPRNSTPVTPRETGSCCENCGMKFNFLKRKRTCADCCMDFCSSCVKDLTPDNSDQSSGSSRRNRCRRCRVFGMKPLERSCLMDLRVRDLRWYLASRRVSAQYCKEKCDLVDLILQSNGHKVRGSTETSNFSEPTENTRDQYQTTAPEGAEIPSSDNQSPVETSSAEDERSWVFVTPQDGDDGQSSVRLASSSETGESRESEESAATNNSIASQAKQVSNESSTDFKPFNVDDLSSEQQVQELSVRQLKLLLTRNFVDYKGCCEKEELLEKALRLWKEKESVKGQDPDDIPDLDSCKICMERVIDCVLLECGHMVTCTLCGKRLNECPICRQYVVRAVRIFKS